MLVNSSVSWARGRAVGRGRWVVGGGSWEVGRGRYGSDYSSTRPIR